MVQVFSHSLRILTCVGCGAPVATKVAGGHFRCSYCGAELVLEARDEARDIAQAGQSLAMSEMERMARLRDQQRETRLPSSLLDLVGADGRLLIERAQDAKRAWLAARAELGATPSFSASERLFHLTWLLIFRGRPEQRRAFLETASETVSDEGHRHVLRCLLARYAAGAGI